MMKTKHNVEIFDIGDQQLTLRIDGTTLTGEW